MAGVTDTITGQGIFTGAPRVGLRNVGSYMVSGHPFITGSATMHDVTLLPAAGTSGSAGMFRTDGEGTNAKPAELRINFPYVSKKINVITSGSNSVLRIHFDSIHPVADTKNRVIEGNHFIQLDGDEESFELSAKCSTIYLSTPNTTTGFQLYAELTNIHTGSMYTLTGSGISE